MRPAYGCYAFGDVEKRWSQPYILYMMIDNDTQTITLKLNYKQAALLSHAVVEFQDDFHRMSHEDMFISEDDIIQLQNLVDQVLEQTEIEVYADVSPHVFENE